MAGTEVGNSTSNTRIDVRMIPVSESIREEIGSSALRRLREDTRKRLPGHPDLRSPSISIRQGILSLPTEAHMAGEETGPDTHIPDILSAGAGAWPVQLSTEEVSQ